MEKNKDIIIPTKRKVGEIAVTTPLTKTNSREKDTKEGIISGDGKRRTIVKGGGKGQTRRIEARDMEEQSMGRESTSHANANADLAGEGEIQDGGQGWRPEPPFSEWLLPGEQRMY